MMTMMMVANHRFDFLEYTVECRVVELYSMVVSVGVLCVDCIFSITHITLVRLPSANCLTTSF